MAEDAGVHVVPRHTAGGLGNTAICNTQYEGLYIYIYVYREREREREREGERGREREREGERERGTGTILSTEDSKNLEHGCRGALIEPFTDTAPCKGHIRLYWNMMSDDTCGFSFLLWFEVVGRLCSNSLASAVVILLMILIQHDSMCTILP